jgi:hypothetical protein
MEKDDNDIKQKQIIAHRRNARLALFVGIPLLLLAPFFLTGFSYFKWANFTTTGQIGDTIGGITAPIVNLISAVLIYLSFRQQLLANEIQIDLINAEKNKDISRSERELLIFHYQEIKSSINSLKYESTLYSNNGNKIYYGTEALEIFIKEIIKTQNGTDHFFWFSINLVLIDIDACIDFLKRSEYLDDGDKQFFGFRLHTLYFQNILIPLSDIERLGDGFKKGISIRNLMNSIGDDIQQFDRTPK